MNRKKFLCLLGLLPVVPSFAKKLLVKEEEWPPESINFPPWCHSYQLGSGAVFTIPGYPGAEAKD